MSREKAQLLSRAIDSLMAQTLPASKYEIIIVDDGSKIDDLAALVYSKKKKFHNLKLVRQEPSGLSAGRNLGAKNAKGKIVAFTDNDCIADMNWLREILAGFSNERVVGIEGRITTDYPRRLFTNAPENISGGKYIGANSAYLKETIEKAGYYSERMGFWREDSEFAFRAKKLGKIAFAEKAIIHHPSRKDPAISIFRYLLFLRNEWVCFFCHPADYLHFAGKGVAKDFLKAALNWFFFSVLIFGIFSLNYYIGAIAVLGKFASDLFALSVLIGSNRLAVDFTLDGFFGVLTFSLLDWAKYVAYPLFLILGFFDALLFMVVK